MKAGIWASVVWAGAAGMAMADVPNVATDIPPVHSLAARVMAGVGTPDLVVRPGASPHGYALRVSEAKALDRANLVFFVSDGLTPWLEEMVEPLATKAKVIELQTIPNTLTFPFRESAVFAPHGDDKHEGHDHGDHKHEGHDHGDDKHEGHDHGDDKHEGHDHGDDKHEGRDHGDNKHEGHDKHAEGGDGHDGHDHHGHDHSGADPHSWLDPANGKVWMAAMAEELAKLDPDNADAYRKNAKDGIAEIDAAIAKATEILAPVKDAKFVTFHDAYQYYERRFGLRNIGSISMSDARKPGPGRVKEIRDAVRAQGVACVFSEPQFNAGLVNTVFEGSSAKTGLLDPLGVELEQGAALYPALVVALAQEMATCMSPE
ncbi:zinc ABC transporter substrate-binding protein [Rhodobacteraceae bacterium D3-12]|nr:zinc ABC transporter substrate-binding protein [Rhodobacteraceae bacterium D3-12]